MSKIKQNKIPMTLTEDNVLKVAVEQGVIENEFNWKLVREHDGLTNQSKEIMWLDFRKVIIEKFPAAPGMPKNIEKFKGKKLLFPLPEPELITI